jgi:putative oxidoreductase
MKNIGFLAGRLIFGGFFLYNGINHIIHKDQLVPYAGAKKVPVPEAAVLGSGALLIASGLSVVLGLKPRLGALGLITFLAAVSPAMHNFWEHEDPGQRQNDMIHFSKNMAMLGAAVALLGLEKWPASVAE